VKIVQAFDVDENGIPPAGSPGSQRLATSCKNLEEQCLGCGGGERPAGGGPPARAGGKRGGGGPRGKGARRRWCPEVWLESASPAVCYATELCVATAPRFREIPWSGQAEMAKDCGKDRRLGCLTCDDTGLSSRAVCAGMGRGCGFPLGDLDVSGEQ
jgi:hypothetical protein